MSTNLKIAKASLYLMIASISGHLLSLFKEILVASRFGITREMDSFYAAITIPNLLNNIFLAAFGSVFIPIFIKYKLNDEKEAKHILSIVINYVILLFIVVSLALLILSPYLIKFGFHGFDPSTAEVAVKILRILSFSIILSGLIGVMSGILNTYENFFMPAISQMFITIATILCIIFLYETAGIFSLVYGLIIGLAVQLIFVVLLMKKKGFSHVLDLSYSHPALKELLLLFVNFFIVINIAEISTVIDRIMASYLAPGSVAALGYGAKLVQVPLIIFSVSITTAVFPYFAKQVAENKIAELKDSLSKSINMSAFIFLPLTVLLVILAKPLVQLLFQRGAFDANATNLTSIVFTCFSFQLFFYSILTIFLRVSLAFQETMIYMKISIFGIILNIILNLILMKIFNPPVAGIALSTSIVLMVSCLIFIKFIHDKYVKLDWRDILGNILKILILSFIMGSVILLFSYFSTTVMQPASVFARALCLCLSAFSGIAVFSLSAYLIKLKEMQSIINIAASKLFNSRTDNPL